MGYFKSRVIQFYISFLLRFYDLVFAVPSKLKNYYINSSHRIMVIYSGVNLEKSCPGQQLLLVFTIGYTGNAKPYQGVGSLLEVAYRLKQKNLFPFRLNLILSGGWGNGIIPIGVLIVSSVTLLLRVFQW